jgi:DNA-binding protein HU-beta
MIRYTYFSYILSHILLTKKQSKGEMKIMNKAGLVEVLANAQGISKKQAEENVDAVFTAIREGLVSDELVEITKEIKFELVPTKARVARNPSTGAEVQVAAGRKLKIKPLKYFKDLV